MKLAVADRNYAPVVIALALAAAIYATLVVNPDIIFPLDDAYITIGNAELLIAGGIDNYDNESPTGATSLIHLILLACLAIVVPTPSANFILSMVSTGLYTFGLYRLLDRDNAGKFVPLFGTLVGLFAGNTWFQLMNGLETGLALAAITWALVLVLDQAKVHFKAGTGVLLGVLPFIRPELFLLSLGFLAVIVSDFQRKPKEKAMHLAAMIVSLCIFGVAAWVLTGSIIPSTAGAKTAYFAESTHPFFFKMFVALSMIAQSPIFLIIIGQLFLFSNPIGWVLNGFTVAVLVAAALKLPSGLFHNDYRYLYVLMPFGIYGWVFYCRNKGSRGRIARSIILAAGIVSIVNFPTYSFPKYREGLNVTMDQEDLSNWAKNNLSSDARIMIHDAGYFSWKTEFSLIDAVGLKTPSSVKIHQRITLPSRGSDRGRAIDEIARVGKASYAIILDRPFWRDIKVYLEQHGWELIDLRPDNPGVYRIYELNSSDVEESLASNSIAG